MYFILVESVDKDAMVWWNALWFADSILNVEWEWL